LGETVVGQGKRNLILGTKATLDMPQKPVPDKAHQALPSGIFVGKCGDLLSMWRNIEDDILFHWGFRNDLGDWKDQRPFYRYLRDKHFVRWTEQPGLIWAVPYWVRTASKLVEPYLEPKVKPFVRDLKEGDWFSFGRAGGEPEIKIPPRYTRPFRFQTMQGAGERDFVPCVVNRDRMFLNGTPYIRDNFILAGVRGDSELEHEGANRATLDLYQQINGWKLNGAWVIVSAAFKGDVKTACTGVVYTHQVIDPFTKCTHGIGRPRIGYDDFWRSSYGRTEAVFRLMCP
jgi:hypothetical protein